MSKEVLVVDDEPMICKALSALFVEKGFHVTTATTAHEALRLIEHLTADVVLLDLKLPDGSGLDVLSELKAKFPRLRVIVISAFADHEMIQQVFQRGASDYLAKPFDFGRCFYAAMGIPTMEIDEARPEPSALARLPAHLARTHRVLPLRWIEGTLQVAMADPLDVQQVDLLQKRLGCPIAPVAAIGSRIGEAISRWYGSLTEHQDGWDGMNPSTTLAQPETSPSAITTEEEASTEVAALARELIRHAAARGVSDLHMGLGPRGLWVRERIDGVISEPAPSAALAERYPQVAAYLKQLARLEVRPCRAPQEGRMTLEVDASKLELHLSVLPTGYGDHLAIQFRTPSTLLTLERLGLMPDQRRRLAGLVTKPTGLLLVTGPSGCGMSTTLYALLASLNTGSATIVTLEDRIDYELPGVTQVQAQPEAGLTVAAGLRSILRHDPTVLMVSDVPDRETARLTVQAALTGHVVLAGLRTQDTATAVRRLLDLSVEPFFLCSSVLGIVAQRLVRRLCVSCRQPAAVGAPAFAAMGITPPKSVGMVKAWRARGCERCHRTGYEGRAAIFELLAIDHHIRSLIIKGIPSGSLRQSAMSRGMTGLLEAGWEKVQTGETSLEELLRVFPRERR